ncbi:fido domain-containing protein [Ilyonectria robusta]|uniref:fido domain-containing protein n=1 Tax=Ilyonectria robusta TaxID=1079257 RepID=UPI001E8E242B|nr:fido domain-containing protein [Ilyonectria robusta]KAH8675010.1 fido domain-containing protein [Ilyonectria robusta]
MDDAYDYNVLDDDVDPDDLYEELKLQITTVYCSPPLRMGSFERYLENPLGRMVFGSNMIEGAGGGRDITHALCRPIFRGDQIPEIEEGDSYYRVLERDLAQNPPNYDTLHFTTVCINNEALSEDIILQTHRILTHKVDAEQGMSWTEYSGVYRECDVSAGLNQFMDPRLVPGAMRAMIRSLDDDIQWAVDSGEIDPVSLAAKYSHTFVNIHPFVDGNGRMCRLILNALLLKYSGVLVCIGVQGYDRDRYLEIAAAGSMAEATAQDDTDGLDEHHKPKHYKGPASFILEHARDNMRELINKQG